MSGNASFRAKQNCLSLAATSVGLSLTALGLWSAYGNAPIKIDLPALSALFEGPKAPATLAGVKAVRAKVQLTKITTKITASPTALAWLRGETVGPFGERNAGLAQDRLRSAVLESEAVFASEPAHAPFGYHQGFAKDTVHLVKTSHFYAGVTAPATAPDVMLAKADPLPRAEQVSTEVAAAEPVPVAKTIEVAALTPTQAEPKPNSSSFDDMPLPPVRRPALVSVIEVAALDQNAPAEVSETKVAQIPGLISPVLVEDGETEVVAVTPVEIPGLAENQTFALPITASNKTEALSVDQAFIQSTEKAIRAEAPEITGSLTAVARLGFPASLPAPRKARLEDSIALATALPAKKHQKLRKAYGKAFDGAAAPTASDGSGSLANYSTKDQKCMAEAIYFEARSEPIKGQLAVAQVVINRVKSEIYPDNVCDVVYQNKHKRNACQFSFACDGIADRARDKKSWQVASTLATEMLEGVKEVNKLGETATHYHARYVNPSWISGMTKLSTIGQHVFYEICWSCEAKRSSKSRYRRRSRSKSRAKVTNNIPLYMRATDR